MIEKNLIRSTAPHRMGATKLFSKLVVRYYYITEVIKNCGKCGDVFADEGHEIAASSA
jgi:hypothetical protein